MRLPKWLCGNDDYQVELFQDSIGRELLGKGKGGADGYACREVGGLVNQGGLRCCEN